MSTIGIDVTALIGASPGGIGTSQYWTMRALAELDTPHRFIMYATRPPVVPFSARPLDLPWELRLGQGQTTRSNIVWMQTGINKLLAEDGVDLFWSPRHLLPFRARGVALVATIQDFWDRHFPGQQPFLNRTANSVLIERIVRRADALVVPSHSTAEDLVRFFGRPAAPLTVVPLGVDHREFSPASAERIAAARATHRLERPYLLALDVYNPRKNFANVLRAVSLLAPGMREGIEVLGVGRPRKTARVTDPAAEAAAVGLSDNLRLASDVPPDELVALYSGALAFVYPSVYEGFGMPVLEAMACGSAVIAADCSSLPEVADDAALLVDPDAPPAIAAAIERVAGDAAERERLASAGVERARGFTWERTAREMLAVFDRVLAS